MADDIILTEEEQVEQLKKWLKNNALSIVLGISLGLASIFGYNHYSELKINTAQQASALYEELLSADDAIDLVADKVAIFKSDYSDTPYAAKVTLLNAKRLAETGQVDEAIKELSWVLKNTKEELVEHTARLRQAQLLIESDKISDAGDLLKHEKIAGFESHYQELQGDIAAKNKDFQKASELYESALENSVDTRYNTYLQLKTNKMKSLSKSALK